MEVMRLTQLPVQIERLAALARHERYRHVNRLIEEFRMGKNRFDAPGEVLLCVLDEQEDLVAIGGLNRDPYEPKFPAGRVRRLYVHPQMRRRGYASALMAQIEASARKHFHTLQLYTDSPDADEFYTSRGYSRVAAPKVSHRKRLRTS